MIYILTEDKQSGYKFFTKLSKIFETEVTVLTTSYGSSDGNAGNSKFLNAITNLLNNGILTKNDVLFIAVDNFVVTSDKFAKELDTLTKHLSKCYKLLKKNKIQYFTSTYVCWEELLLSFEYLVEFCSTGNRDDIAIQKYLKYKDNFVRGCEFNDFSKVFGTQQVKNTGVEYCLSELLRKISTGNDFQPFKVTKTDIGCCWYNDCSCVVPKLMAKAKANCSHCYAVKRLNICNSQSALERLKFVYKHSMFIQTLRDLKLVIKK